MLQSLFHGWVPFLFIFLAACSSTPPLKEASHHDLTEFVMNESLLNTALRAAIGAAPNCIQPFEKSLPEEAYAKMASLLHKNFQYESLHASIRQRLIALTERKDVLVLAEGLDGELWQKFLMGMQAANKEDDTRYTKIMQELEEGRFDLTSRRSVLVSKITDQTYMLNLVKLSNSQVLNMVKTDPNKALSKKQQGVLQWVDTELKTFNDAHIRSLFVGMWLSTEKFSEEELQELVQLRSHPLIKLARDALEEELSLRYRAFFTEMKRPGK